MGDQQRRKYSKESVENILKQKKGFIIIALTGKVKAGTSDVCDLLTDEKFCDRVTKPANTAEITMSEARERTLCYRYLHHNWKTFVEINVSSIILSLWIEGEGKNEQVEPETKEIYDKMKNVLKGYIGSGGFKEDAKAFIYKMHRAINEDEDDGNNDFQIIDDADDTLFNSIKSYEALCNKWRELAGKLERNEYMTKEMIYFCYGVLPAMNYHLEKNLKKEEKFTEIYQDLGNNIRAYGKARPQAGDEYRAEGIFCIPRRINKFLKILRHYKNIVELENQGEKVVHKIKSNQLCVVINNLKNNFEAFYFRCRYASFYLLAVSCDEDMRKNRFKSDEEYRLAELNENLRAGKKVFQRAEKYRKGLGENESISEWLESKSGQTVFNEEEIVFLKKVYKKGSLRKECYKNGLAGFVLQDVVECIENADLFLQRNFHEPNAKCDYDLTWSLGRMVTLMMHPGLLTPTKEEKCMQVAMTAKLNSGCLSRQVGAVVTDPEYNILSLGWNDAPCGAESCIRRNMFDLFRNHDKGAYSDFELYDTEFRKYLTKIEDAIGEERKRGLGGLPYAFCFKDIYQEIIQQKDQIYTRAMHGEERALVMCGNERLKGGYLFTTSSPCELCAKKIKEAGIKKIYYIQQYKGISRSHIIQVGEQRTEFILFTGAIGLAYVNFYTPMMPYKDEMKAMGYDPTDLYNEKDDEVSEKMKTEAYGEESYNDMENKYNRSLKIGSPEQVNLDNRQGR